MEQRYTNSLDKLAIAIRKEIQIGGRVFCWHKWVKADDYIYGPMKYLCYKCGKSKITKIPIVEDIS